VDAPAPKTRFLGRQPILDVNLNLFGYELLFRAGPDNAFSGDPEEATRRVTDNYLMMVPEANRSTAFVNCTREVLALGLVTLLPPHNTVLEILEDVTPDEEVLASCAALKAQGYRFALDDFSPDPWRVPFLEFADFIKVDFRASDAAERQRIYAMAAGCGATLLAEKVETADDMELARAEGCTLFQGYFFSRPMVMAQRAIPRNHLTYLRLLAALCRQPTDINEVEMLIKSEMSICYALLRLVNSALYGLPKRVASIRNALLMVGDDGVRKLVTVALAGVFAESHSQTLISMALERAKFCELLAPVLHEQASKLYLLGMFSLIDAVVQIPMTQIVKSLPLELDMIAALTGKESPLRIALDMVRCYEAGNWSTCEAHQRTLGLTESAASMLYVESLHWADSVMEHLQLPA
jgi:EAL and modified HD-GYP domain-containing signal transduction protein